MTDPFSRRGLGVAHIELEQGASIRVTMACERKRHHQKFTPVERWLAARSTAELRDVGPGPQSGRRLCPVLAELFSIGSSSGPPLWAFRRVANSRTRATPQMLSRCHLVCFCGRTVCSATISIFDTSICDNLPLYVTLYTCSTRLPLLPLAPLLLYAPLPVYLLCFLAFLLSSKFQESQFLDTCMTQLLLARFPSFVAVLDV